MTSFVNNATHIEVWDGLTQLLNIPKSNCSFKKISGSSLCVFDFEHRKLLIDYVNVILPASTNIDDLLVILNGYLLEWEQTENNLLAQISTGVNSITTSPSNGQTWLQRAFTGPITTTQSAFSIQSSRDDLSPNNEQHIWRHSGNSYTFPTVANILSIVSSSSNDTLLGTGARSVLIEGLDSTYTYQTEVVNMNGISSVTTTKQFLRVNMVYVVSAGTLQTNVGNITVTHLGNVVDFIEAGYSHSMSSQYSIGAGKKIYITKLIINGSSTFASSNRPIKFRFYFRSILTPAVNTKYIAREYEARDTNTINDPGRVLVGPVDLWVTAINPTLDLTTNAYATISGVIF